ncbi:MAG: hypothetical protein CM15mP2_3580 [Methanobacteriota archaeon]|nr:MAG: hypothetical protein CM15mP2_3580 [Euryarchaeota archaeon]
MSCKHLRSDYNIAWPTAELAVMGAEGAVNIIHRREINAAEDADKEDVRAHLVDEYKAKFGDPYVAARNGWLDDVIEPSESRMRLIRALNILRSKRSGVHQKARQHTAVITYSGLSVKVNHSVISLHQALVLPRLVQAHSQPRRHCC